jgi:TRAP-type mannitol/chloroaromatic compound transport system permease small subunit
MIQPLKRWMPAFAGMTAENMASVTKIADGIDRFNAAVGRGAAWLALVIILLQFVLVVARYLFSLGSIWLSETVIYAHAALFLLAAAWTLQLGGHVRVDIFYADAGPRTKAWIDLAGALLLLFPVMLVLLWLSWPYAARSWAVLERSQEASGLPLVFVLKTFIPVFAALMALQGVAQVARAVLILIPPPKGEGGRRSRPGGVRAGRPTPPRHAPRGDPPRKRGGIQRG